MTIDQIIIVAFGLIVVFGLGCVAGNTSRGRARNPVVKERKMARCTKLDWQVTTTMERVVAELTFDNFDQSMRFINVLINFLREEKAIAQAPHPPKATLGQNDFAEQGQVSGSSQASSRTDGQHLEQTDTGSVT